MLKFFKISWILVLFFSLSTIVLAGGIAYSATKSEESEIVVYPNPVFDNQFTISSEEEIQELYILNVLGQVVYVQKEVLENKVRIELETSDKGIYLIQIRTGDGKLATKRVLFK